MEALLAAGIVLVSLVGVYFAYQAIGGGAHAIKRRFARLPLTTVSGAGAAGTYRLSGRARPLGDDAPVSQASGRAFLAQDLRIVPSDGSESGSTRAAQRAVDFLLDDGTGVALIRAEECLVAIERDFEAPRTTLDEVPWVDELLRAGGYRNGSPATCNIRLYEGVLEPDGQVGVIGHVEPADAAARAHGASVVVRPHGSVKLMIRSEAAAPPED